MTAIPIEIPPPLYPRLERQCQLRRTAAGKYTAIVESATSRARQGRLAGPARAARHLRRSGGTHVFVTNRTHERAVEMAKTWARFSTSLKGLLSPVLKEGGE